ncbi:MAG: hypothetical protein KJP07_01940, partial [Desulfatitalea sp.]|nr:hypothetical protein [Desulfatitalea sp.]
IALPTRGTSLLSQQVFEHACFMNQGNGPEDLSAPPPGRTEGARIVSLPAALVAHVFGFGGAAYTLDAACASSLYALKLACDELQGFRADAMITGGVSGADNLYTQIGFSQLRALSPSGRCAPFDRSADGLVVGEGAGILVLKRLDDAQRDGDTIYGIIRGIGLSNDMRGNLLAPESNGQLRAMHTAYRQAGWRPWQVDHIECHGAGTPVGDAIELASLSALWQEAPKDARPCAIGSVKSMIGHLLTAAGAAGLIKTLLGLHHKTLPPSLKFERAADQSPLHDGPFRVQAETAPWEPRGSDFVRRAAVSAFGFGGINGHVLIEEVPQRHADGPDRQTRSIEVRPCDDNRPEMTAAVADNIAIVGMETCFGKLTSLTMFQQAVFSGTPIIDSLPDGRWKAPHAAAELFCGAAPTGAFVSDVSVELGEFRIPPGEVPDILPQQLLMLRVAGQALGDAGMAAGAMHQRMGTVIGIGFDFEANNFNFRWHLPLMMRRWAASYGLNIDEDAFPAWCGAAKTKCGPPLTAARTLGALGGIVASRVAREFRFGGPSFVVSAEEASGLRAVQIAMGLLRAGDVDAMLVGAVDLAGDERNLLSRFSPGDFSPTGCVRPFDRSADGTLPGEGAAALVLKREADAVAAADRIYAVIRGTGGARYATGPSLRPTVGGYCISLERAMADARIDTDAIGLMETSGSGHPTQDDVEAEALNTAFASRPDSGKNAMAIGATPALIGHTGAATGLAALVKCALSLHHHLLAPLPGFAAPRFKGWGEGRFHFPRQAAYWPWDHGGSGRTACVAGMTADGNCMHAVLVQAPAVTAKAQSADVVPAPSRPLGPLPFALFVITAMDRSGLLDAIRDLHGRYRRSKNALPALPLEHLAHEWFHQHRNGGSKPFALSIVADRPEDLFRHLAEAVQAVQADRPLMMGVRGGVCYLPQWRGESPPIAFVFPGSGNHYVGMGRILGAHFPEVLREMDARTEKLNAQMLPHLYDPWRMAWPESWPGDSYRNLNVHPLHAIFGQVVFGGQMARLLKRFQVGPDALIGYSLGESAGLFALDAWPDQGGMLARLAESDLFRDELAGECRCLRRAWQIPNDQAVHWQVAVVNRPANVVDRTIAGISHVRRLIVNTPGECVIGGLKEPVAQAIDQLKCEAYFLDGVVTVHCDAARPAAQAYRELHRFPTTPVPGLRIYSCARAAAYDLTSEAAADSILAQALHGFDFPRTIHQAHADGIRLFVEVGPRASCTRMIRQIC